MPQKPKYGKKQHKKKYKQPINSKGWNSDVENTMNNLEKKCEIYRWLFTTGSGKLHKKGQFLGIFNVVIMAINATIQVVNIQYNNSAITIISVIILFINTMSVGIAEFLQLKGQAEKYKDAASKFEELKNMIHRQLILESDQRQDAKDFIVWIEREFKNVFESSPLISPGLLSEFEKKFESQLNPEFMEVSELNEVSDSKLKLGESNENVFLSEKGNTNFSDYYTKDIRMKYEISRYTNQ